MIQWQILGGTTLHMDNRPARVGIGCLALKLRRVAVATCLGCSLVVLVGCGQKGPLYLSPAHQATPATAVAPTAPSSGSAAARTTTDNGQATAR